MRFILTGALLALLGAAAGATTLVPTDLGQLSTDAYAIARGRIVAADAQWTDGRRTIETIVTLDVENYLKGRLGDTVQFRVPGGVMGRFRNVVVGAPRFSVGERVIVFLGARGPTVPFVVGLGQGVFRIIDGPAGESLVTPPAVSPEVLGPIVRGNPERRPAPLADFERQVRALAETAR